MVEGYVWEQTYRNDVKSQYQAPKRMMAEVGVEPGPAHMQGEKVTARPAANISTHGRRMFTMVDVRIRICLINYCHRIGVSNIYCERKE